MLRRFRRAVLVLTVVGLLAAAVVAVSASPASAYGKATWQVTANGTGVAPGTGFGLGFWGWCEFAGGVTSGNDGDCEFAQYVHGAGSFSFTCHFSMDITSWTGAGGTFVITGTATASPAAVAGLCLAFFPGAASFSGVDTGIPSAPGQYHSSNPFGQPVGEFNMTVTQIP
jgi:hypothetical protein